MVARIAPLGLLLLVHAGGALFRPGLSHRGTVKPLDLDWSILQLDAGGEGGGGGGRVQEASVVEEAEDSTALLGEGIKDETILCREKK